ncbi:MAG: hypothetical protein ACXAC7_04575 [Candidatus Hodarchaeales archaeon]|jgi:hypothetical protein
MKIAIIGWGSLIWDPRNLESKGDWQKDGPELPIEFARVSKDGRLTLAIHPGSNVLTTLWIESSNQNLNNAITNLRKRERCHSQNIGYVNIRDEKTRIRSENKEIMKSIEQWLIKKKYDAVIWTDLPPNFAEKTGKDFTKENVLTYIKSLEGETLRKAQKYIVNAPQQIRTRLRTALEEI